MCVVVEQAGQPYALVIDSVGDVISVPADRFEQNPATLSPHWRQVSAGVYRLETELLVVADVASLLADDIAVAA
jgi:purine-binding chemotaxis protein CheW